MPRVLVVSLRGQYNHLIKRRLTEVGAEADMLDYTMVTREKLEEYDCVVYGGGPFRIPQDAEKLAQVLDLLREPPRPTLGICLSLHLMIHAHGGRVGPAEHPEFGGVEIEVLDEDLLFRGLPRRFFVWESHNDEVKVVPEGFRVIARSQTCPVQAVVHERLPLYGVQFHPEVQHTQHGHKLFQNFLEACKR
ncbi:GMP synthase, small subunit [Pyrolobus fumarii 1A]|uniref:GMP synthase [glutamine-hydrolyzing] subunit A n=1 Tax=Pyrolobus fumarii (strain DSM 11204 / 1A) TaxID=694429 RepID=G0ECN6_PYRF1|nr:GMP synthase subunit A [Pyrolobus fumarii]AEM39606.1 GMP synthase, small subunit [Pyrolobus fumarii 1A]